jgi:hypothetical protein
MKNNNNSNTRREFIRTIGRGILFTGLIGTSGYLLFRNKEGSVDICKYDFLCKNCKKLKSCSLPEAKDFKTQSPKTSRS